MSDKSKPDELTQTIIKTLSEKKPQNVQQLVNLVKEQAQLSEEKITNAILKLQNQGKIRLDAPPLQPSLDLTQYLKTEKALWYWATISIAALAIAVIFTVPEDFYPWRLLRNALGLIFVLWLPGYTFIRALFPLAVPIRTSSKTLDSIERFALSLGISLALTPIVGLILYYTPFSLTLAPITLSLFILTIVFATAAMFRESHAKDTAASNKVNCT